MLTTEKITEEFVTYTCSCGIIGKCFFKSFSIIGPSILNIRCPSCSSSLNIKIGEVPLVKQEEDINYSLSVVISNEIVKREEVWC